MRLPPPLLFLALLASPAWAQSPDSVAEHRHDQAPQIRAARLEGAIRIDGRLDEPAWISAEPATAFTQIDPKEGEPASERTEVRVLFDREALYVGARLYDREAGKVKARLARRDDPSQSDLFEVFLDAYHDHVTASRFRVNAAGAIRDAAIGAGGSEDASWDSVWEAGASVDSLGWTAEMRIPFSQLRYNAQSEAVWGVQFARLIFRTGEADLFSFTPKKEQGGVRRYGHLVGLGRLPASRRLELMPYASSRNERLHFAGDDPFRSRSDYFGAAGVDLKYGLTSDLTLDATINPDFGQVEVDPAEVNLTAFETLFPEKRAFFVESASLFNFGQSNAFNRYGSLTVFNSRRIGRAPQRNLQGPEFQFVDAPDQTTIVGAAKLTGKTAGGWSIGAIDAVTHLERADILDTAGVHREIPVEPLTHYFAGRLKHDFRAGNTVVGGIFTAVDRRLDDPALANLLRKNAYTGGLDLNHFWNDQRWALDASVTGSLLQGTPAAIAIAQRSPVRYLQRPDHADYFTYDPGRTSLGGYSADAALTKVSGNHWTAALSYASKSPGQELNDFGFQSRADYRSISSIVQYQENAPGRWLRNYGIYPYANQAWNFGGDRIYNAYSVGTFGTFANFWSFNASSAITRRAFDDRLTRGGPTALLTQGGNWSVDLTSDSRKSYSLDFAYTYSWNKAGGRGETPSITASFRPSPSLRLAFEPQYSITHALAQYVTTVVDPAATATYGRRYVFSSLDQRLISLVTRVDWTFTPKLTLQLYVQPLIVSGAYSRFKEFRTPRTFDWDVYGEERGSIARDASGTYTVDPGNGSTFQFGDPDFNFRSLLGNAVLRWEYRPGSTLFVVWQQHRTDAQGIGDFDFSRDYGALFRQSPENVFAVKATWWVGL
jgi:Domain of unknown function (DUF5916)/Carbohydrate family 9 binding domain-like